MPDCQSGSSGLHNASYQPKGKAVNVCFLTASDKAHYVRPFPPLIEGPLEPVYIPGIRTVPEVSGWRESCLTCVWISVYRFCTTRDRPKHPLGYTPQLTQVSCEWCSWCELAAED